MPPRIIQVDPSLIDQPQHRCRREHLADRAVAEQGVLVHRVAVVHVELYHRADRFEFRQKGRQNAQFV